MYIRSNHSYAYRSGQWGKIIDIFVRESDGRRCYGVEWDDPSAMDLWPVVDDWADYEFTETV